MRKFVFMLMIAAFMCCLCACAGKTAEITDNLSYDMALTLDGGTLDGSETVTYDNIYADKLTESVFHLYANAYAENAANPAYSAKPQSYGGIAVTGVTSDGETADYTVSDDGEYLTVKHASKDIGDKVSIGVAFNVTLPECALRLGYINGSYNLSEFYPQLSVFSDGAFRTDKYSSVGDPVFSETADYDVRFTCPNSLVVASSAKCAARTDDTTTQTLTFSGDNLRDFAMACNSDYNVISTKSGDTSVYYFYTEDETAQNTLDTAADALTKFGEAFGAYPYDTFSVVRVPFDGDGMEYGGLVYVSERTDDVIGTVIHETAHEWWYGTVGNDSINSGYLDEGLATFCEAYYYKLTGDDATFENKISTVKRAYVSYEKLQSKRKTGLNLQMDYPVYDYTDYQYVMVEYYKGCMMFDNLYELYGADKFNECMKKYCETYKFKIADTKGFSDVASDVFGTDVSGLVNGWISGKVVATTFAAE